MANLQDIAAIWGAALSTLLATIQGAGWFLRRPKLRVTARIMFEGASKDDKRGPIYNDPIQGPRLVRLQLEVTNTGGRSVQVMSVYFDYPGNVAQVRPHPLPIILAPDTGVELMVQKEWLDLGSVEDFGVQDAVGRKHPATRESSHDVRTRASALPTTVKQYRKKGTAEAVPAFQVQDDGQILPKRR